MEIRSLISLSFLFCIFCLFFSTNLLISYYVPGIILGSENMSI